MPRKPRDQRLERDIDIEVMNNMLDDPDYNPAFIKTSTTDYETDSIRALWVLEHQLFLDHITKTKPTTPYLKNKYNLRQTQQFLLEVTNFNTGERMTKSQRGSINKLREQARKAEKYSLRSLKDVQEVNLKLKGKEAQLQLINLLSRYKRLGWLYRRHKNEDNKIEIMFPEVKGKNKLCFFNTYQEALLFLTGFIQGHEVAKYKELQKWETKVLYELQKRNTREGKG